MVEQLNYEGVKFPVSVKDYGKIEEQNSININVFGYENKEFYPFCVSEQHNEDILNLILITKGENMFLSRISIACCSIRPNTRRESIFACIASNVSVVRIFYPNVRPVVW